MFWLKIGIAAAIVGALTWLGMIVNGWHEDARKVPLLQDQLERAAWALDRRIESERVVQAASKGYQDELSNLRSARDAAPVRSVRLCVVPEGPAGTGQPSGGEPGPDGATPGSGGVPPQAGPDIGPELYALIDRADELSAQVRGLQEYARSCAAP